jgi:hypothetical protein
MGSDGRTVEHKQPLKLNSDSGLYIALQHDFDNVVSELVDHKPAPVEARFQTTEI